MRSLINSLSRKVCTVSHKLSIGNCITRSDYPAQQHNPNNGYRQSKCRSCMPSSLSMTRDLRNMSVQTMSEQGMVVEEHIPVQGCNSKTIVSRELTTPCLMEDQNATRDSANNVRDTRVEIVLDSGATSHMFPDKSLFQDIQSGRLGDVSMGDSSQTCPIEGKGTVNILGESLYVPKLRYGLVSLSKLDQLDCKITVEKGRMIVQNSDKIDILTAHLKRNLYHLCDRDVDRLRMLNGESLNIVGIPSALEDLDMIDDTIEMGPRKRVRHNFSEEEKTKIDRRFYLLHHQWGHLSEGRMKLAHRRGLVKGIEFTDEEIARLPFCYDCHRGKMRAFPSGDTTAHEWREFQKVAVDYKGPIPVKSLRGYRGFYLFSDYCTHHVWVYMVKSKTEFIDALESYMKFIESFGWKNRPQILQGDYDSLHTEKKTNQWLKNRGIKLQLSAPFKHAQNGQIERDMQNVLDRTRTMMSIYDAPFRMWEFAVRYAVELINMSPTSTAENKTPYEQIYHEKPDISQLIPFYTPGVFHNPKETRGASLGPRLLRVEC